MTKPFLSIERLTQRFPDGKGGQVTVFEDASFGIERGEFVCILGHSGCGKSTIMNILAGLAEPTSGVVAMDGYEVSGPSLDRGVVFQNYSLLPWLSALGNVRFGVRARHPDWSRARIDERAREYLAMVGLKGEAIDRKPKQLSGGMRQRVSIARAFANHPKLLLLDEPFGALDALTRGTIQDELLKIWSGTGQTVFMITHDIDEAILLADRILLMSNGPYARVAGIGRDHHPAPARADGHHRAPELLPDPQPFGAVPRQALERAVGRPLQGAAAIPRNRPHRPDRTRRPRAGAPPRRPSLTPFSRRRPS
ncbi:ABC transporter ATP-binding protein [Paracoccus sp. NBH48]|uniref:ABC transporter ATP-binding protein n=1 Tax=Paracoccus sp. NBH48 TaxID=2596918 RepID=UPI0021064264|nr:ABC transporter ATP-binding protein [Paracoccus sp. NBH48]